MSKHADKFMGGMLKLKIKKKKIDKKCRSQDNDEQVKVSYDQNEQVKRKEKYEKGEKEKKEEKYERGGIEKKKKKKKEEDITVLSGSGRIVTTKNTIQGFETKFVEEIEKGYKIILKNPTSLQTEERTVISILSNRTLLVDEEFSSDISTTCKYYISKSGRAEVGVGQGKGKGEEAREDAREDARKAHENEHSNTEDKKSTTYLQYAKVIEQKPKHDVIKIRKKVGLWSYKMVDKKIKGNLTNEQKLDERVKSGRDKFCW
ncbi:conserved Plasmodium protein, unknown function [Plasmodium malariae]|uniref:Uncharacterized protein n=1 Tax=Plasmodium malariae TaxID=5858 RepID=A0A1A8VVI4_PLAMA|nr:conserved Plasmodium protein, unknown function [Plasmodium malariae]SBS82843.1 conserved Plasmodium protein, unknown function [Plasmodium malariae]SBT87386.1 conserved Plasmodium protein, unknown function [Plasmodium malariae]